MKTAKLFILSVILGAFSLGSCSNGFYRTDNIKAKKFGFCITALSYAGVASTAACIVPLGFDNVAGILAGFSIGALITTLLWSFSDPIFKKDEDMKTLESYFTTNNSTKEQAALKKLRRMIGSLKKSFLGFLVLDGLVFISSLSSMIVSLVVPSASNIGVGVFESLAVLTGIFGIFGGVSFCISGIYKNLDFS